MVGADQTSVVVIAGAAVLAPLLADRLARWVAVPGVVLELLLGVLAGPVLLGWANDHGAIGTVADFGLAMLMFMAGYEIEFDRIRGGPLREGLTGWVLSLVLGLAAGGLLALTGDHGAGMVVGLALTTTALGTILPILHDAGMVATPFGARVMAVGAIGEFGPIVAVALLLTSSQPGRTVLLLIAFALVTVAAGLLAVRQHGSARMGRLLRATLSTSAQMAVRITMFGLILMLWIAGSFGLDVLLGAFAAGVIERMAFGASDLSPGQESLVDAKLEGIGYGFLVPFFFVVSGIRLDLSALADDPRAVLLVPGFLLLFLVVRGVPTYLVSRRDEALDRPRRRALSLLASTALPLVVVITTIGVEDHRIKTSTAAALVCAAMLSVLLFPLLAMRLAKEPAATGS
ncbi:cation:proton antiporter [Actinomadura rupiterrae]|uniref:cation:proton antiporter n=1 Tax=Actinomadura rupiterrae TaxID=559627 RepID=UPI0020A327E0|nr:cation:proton antiporter [Actinomadura rupiterrae]MCP2338651.1 Kef-type K+ transport system membrane component KefB [Actinomadura rupiterrae]